MQAYDIFAREVRKPAIPATGFEPVTSGLGRSFGPKAGPASGEVTCGSHGGYAAVLNGLQVYQVAHVFPSVVYARVYVSSRKKRRERKHQRKISNGSPMVHSA